MNSKYKMFLNFMHNDLGITKEDIRGWIDEAVEDIVKKRINGKYIVDRMNSRIDEAINILIYKKGDIWSNDSLRPEVKKALAEKIISSINIDLKLTSKEGE